MKGKTSKETSSTISHVVAPQDANAYGNVHGGTIMYHIDNAAGVVAARHSGSHCVTASIDKINFYNPGFVGEILTFKGSLNLVGRSSMEIGVRVEAENVRRAETRHIASAYLTFVSIDKNRRAVEVPPLILEDETEIRRNREAKDRKARRFS